MNKILALAILIGTSITSGISQSITMNGDIVMGKDTIGTVFSVDKIFYEGGSVTGFDVSIKVFLYKYITKEEKKQIDRILDLEYKEPGYTSKIKYVKNYKNGGEYLIESGDLQNKAIRIRIMGIISGSFLSVIGVATLNPGLVYLGGTVMTASGVFSLITEVKGNNSLINSGKKMKGKNR